MLCVFLKCNCKSVAASTACIAAADSGSDIFVLVKKAWILAYIGEILWGQSVLEPSAQNIRGPAPPWLPQLWCLWSVFVSWVLCVAYPAMSEWLNKTGRPILYSCSWPAYQEGMGIKVNTIINPFGPNIDISKLCTFWHSVLNKHFLIMEDLLPVHETIVDFFDISSSNLPTWM